MFSKNATTGQTVAVQMAGSWGPKDELKLTPAIDIFMFKQIKKIPNVYSICITKTHSQLQKSFCSVNLNPDFYGT